MIPFEEQMPSGGLGVEHRTSSAGHFVAPFASYYSSLPSSSSIDSGSGTIWSGDSASAAGLPANGGSRSDGSTHPGLSIETDPYQQQHYPMYYQQGLSSAMDASSSTSGLELNRGADSAYNGGFDGGLMGSGWDMSTDLHGGLAASNAYGGNGDFYYPLSFAGPMSSTTGPTHPEVTLHSDMNPSSMPHNSAAARSTTSAPEGSASDQFTFPQLLPQNPYPQLLPYPSDYAYIQHPTSTPTSSSSASVPSNAPPLAASSLNAAQQHPTLRRTPPASIHHIHPSTCSSTPMPLPSKSLPSHTHQSHLSHSLSPIVGPSLSSEVCSISGRTTNSTATGSALPESVSASAMTAWPTVFPGADPAHGSAGFESQSRRGADQGHAYVMRKDPHSHTGASQPGSSALSGTAGSGVGAPTAPTGMDVRAGSDAVIGTGTGDGALLIGRARENPGNIHHGFQGEWSTVGQGHVRRKSLEAPYLSQTLPHSERTDALEAGVGNPNNIPVRRTQTMAAAAGHFGGYSSQQQKRNMSSITTPFGGTTTFPPGLRVSVDDSNSAPRPRSSRSRNANSKSSGTNGNVIDTATWMPPPQTNGSADWAREAQLQQTRLQREQNQNHAPTHERRTSSSSSSSLTGALDARSWGQESSNGPRTAINGESSDSVAYNEYHYQDQAQQQHQQLQQQPADGYVHEFAQQSGFGQTQSPIVSNRQQQSSHVPFQYHQQAQSAPPSCQQFDFTNQAQAHIQGDDGYGMNHSQSQPLMHRYQSDTALQLPSYSQVNQPSVQAEPPSYTHSHGPGHDNAQGARLPPDENDTQHASPAPLAHGHALTSQSVQIRDSSSHPDPPEQGARLTPLHDRSPPPSGGSGNADHGSAPSPSPVKLEHATINMADQMHAGFRQDQRDMQKISYMMRHGHAPPPSLRLGEEGGPSALQRAPDYLKDANERVDALLGTEDRLLAQSSEVAPDRPLPPPAMQMDEFAQGCGDYERSADAAESGHDTAVVAPFEVWQQMFPPPPVSTRAVRARASTIIEPSPVEPHEALTPSSSTHPHPIEASSQDITSSTPPHTSAAEQIQTPVIADGSPPSSSPTILAHSHSHDQHPLSEPLPKQLQQSERDALVKSMLPIHVIRYDGQIDAHMSGLEYEAYDGRSYLPHDRHHVPKPPVGARVGDSDCIPKPHPLAVHGQEYHALMAPDKPMVSASAMDSAAKGVGGTGRNAVGSERATVTQPRLKLTTEKKTPPKMACYFCRQRKIACGIANGSNKACNQCVRRNLPCKFPKESRRGLRSNKKGKSGKKSKGTDGDEEEGDGVEEGDGDEEGEEGDGDTERDVTEEMYDPGPSIPPKKRKRIPLGKRKGKGTEKGRDKEQEWENGLEEDEAIHEEAEDGAEHFEDRGMGGHGEELYFPGNMHIPSQRGYAVAPPPSSTYNLPPEEPHFASSQDVFIFDHPSQQQSNLAGSFVAPVPVPFPSELGLAVPVHDHSLSSTMSGYSNNDPNLEVQNGCQSPVDAGAVMGPSRGPFTTDPLPTARTRGRKQKKQKR